MKYCVSGVNHYGMTQSIVLAKNNKSLLSHGIRDATEGPTIEGTSKQTAPDYKETSISLEQWNGFTRVNLLYMIIGLYLIHCIQNGWSRSFVSVEFIRGPNVYYRETIASDLENITALVDWEQFPLTLDRTKDYLKGLLYTLRYVQRPYEDYTQCREIFTICQVSDDSFVGLTQYTVSSGKVVDIRLNAGLPSIRGTGLMNEAALLRDAQYLQSLVVLLIQQNLMQSL